MLIARSFAKCLVLLVLVGAVAGGALAMDPAKLPPLSGKSVLMDPILMKDAVLKAKFKGLEADVKAAARFNGLSPHVIIAEEQVKGDTALAYLQELRKSWGKSARFDQSKHLLIVFLLQQADHGKGTMAAHCGTVLQAWGLDSSFMDSTVKSAIRKYLAVAPQQQNPKQAILSIFDDCNLKIATYKEAQDEAERKAAEAARLDKQRRDQAAAAEVQRRADEARRAPQRKPEEQKPAGESKEANHGMFMGFMVLLGLGLVGVFAFSKKREQGGSKEKVEEMGQRVDTFTNRLKRIEKDYAETLSTGRSERANYKDGSADALAYDAAVPAYDYMNECFLLLVERHREAGKQLETGNFSKAESLVVSEPIVLPTAETHISQIKNFWTPDEGEKLTASQLYEAVGKQFAIVNTNLDTMEKARKQSIENNASILELVGKLAAARKEVEGKGFTFTPYADRYQKSLDAVAAVNQIYSSGPIAAAAESGRVKGDLEKLLVDIQSIPAAKISVVVDLPGVQLKVVDLKAQITAAEKVEQELKAEFSPESFKEASKALPEARGVAGGAKAMVEKIQAAQQSQDFLQARDLLKAHGEQVEGAKKKLEALKTRQSELRKLSGEAQAWLTKCRRQVRDLKEKLTVHAFSASNATLKSWAEANDKFNQLDKSSGKPLQADWGEIARESESLDKTLKEIDSSVDQDRDDYKEASKQFKELKLLIPAAEERQTSTRMSTREIFARAKTSYTTLKDSITSPQQNWKELTRQATAAKKALVDFDDQADRDKREYLEYQRKLEHAQSRGCPPGQLEQAQVAYNNGNWSAIDSFLVGYMLGGSGHHGGGNVTVINNNNGGGQQNTNNRQDNNGTGSGSWKSPDDKSDPGTAPDTGGTGSGSWGSPDDSPAPASDPEPSDNGTGSGSWGSPDDSPSPASDPDPGSDAWSSPDSSGDDNS